MLGFAPGSGAFRRPAARIAACRFGQRRQQFAPPDDDQPAVRRFGDRPRRKSRKLRQPPLGSAVQAAVHAPAGQVAQMIISRPCFAGLHGLRPFERQRQLTGRSLARQPDPLPVREAGRDQAGRPSARAVLAQASGKFRRLEVDPSVLKAQIPTPFAPGVDQLGGRKMQPARAQYRLGAHDADAPFRDGAAAKRPVPIRRVIEPVQVAEFRRFPPGDQRSPFPLGQAGELRQRVAADRSAAVGAEQAPHTFRLQRRAHRKRRTAARFNRIGRVGQPFHQAISFARSFFHAALSVKFFA